MKKRLMIDMDDVITDGNFKEQIEEFIGSKIDFKKTGYYLQNALGSRKEEFFKKGQLDMYKDAPLKDDAFEIIKKLNEKYDLYIVSSFIIKDAHYQEGNHLKFKIEYLQKKLPFIESKQIIFTDNKELIDFDIRIDDSIRHLSKGEILLLFDAYHNKELSKEYLATKNIKRVMNWQEVANILL